MPFGRSAVIMHGLAVLILASVGLWGAVLYPNMPDPIPTHWNASGEADAFSPKSVFTVFGPLLIAAAMVLFILAVHFGVSRMRHQVPSERRAQDLTFGYVNLSLAVLFAWVSYAGWYGLSLGPLFIALALMAGVPVLIILGLHLPAIMKERQAVTDPADPSLDPRYWVWGGIFYNNPKDRRAFVPKAPHTGTGATLNLATPGGRLALVGVLLVLLLSFGLLFI